MSEFCGEDWYARLSDNAVELAKQEDRLIKAEQAARNSHLKNYFDELSAITGIDRQAIEEQSSKGTLSITVTDPELAMRLHDAKQVFDFEDILTSAKYGPARAEISKQMKKVDEELKANNRPTIFS